VLDPATLTLLSAGDDVEVQTVAPADAIDTLAAEQVECVVVTPSAGGQPPFAMLEQASAVEALCEVPFLVYCPEPLSVNARGHLEALGESIVVKSVSSPERLVDEAAIFLHRMEARMPAPTRKLLAHLRTADSVFHGKRVLIVDDDIRNVFALASALEVRGMKVLFAENGREGIERLREHPNVDLVLLDVMMPEMDGYETARAIRSMPRFERLPIISLTAKAMKGDRDKSISAGASDYVTKPVDMDQLLSVMRVWLHR
jgi:CheY-like chemotaxis protein